MKDKLSSLRIALQTRKNRSKKIYLAAQRLQTRAYLEKSVLGTPKERNQESDRCVNAILLSPTEKEKAYNTFSIDTTKKQLSELSKDS